MGQIIVLFWKLFQVEENTCRQKEQEWLEKEKAYQEKEMLWQAKEKDWKDERNKYEEKEEILKKKLLEDEKQQKEWGEALQEWLSKAKAYQEKETQWRVKERNWTDERNKFKKREEILKNTLLHDEKQQKEWGKTMQRWLAKAKAYQERETQWQAKEKDWAAERKSFEQREEILKQKLLEYEKQQSDDPEDPTVIKLADEEEIKVTEVLKDSKDSLVESAAVISAEPKDTAGEGEVVEADTELKKPQRDVHVDSTSTDPKEGKPKQVDQEAPTVIKVSDEAVVEASKIQDSKESLGEAGAVASAEPEDDGDLTCTKTSDDEVTESKAEVTKPPITETNSVEEKEAKTTEEASSLLITPQETEKTVDDSTLTNATVSQNSMANPSQSDIYYIHMATKDATDDNQFTNDSSSRKERRKNRKGRNRPLHWSQRPELVTVVSKKPQTEPQEAEIKAEDEVCNTDLAWPPLKHHNDPTVIKPAEPNTAFANPQIEVDVDSTSTKPTEEKTNRWIKYKKINVVEEVKDLKESPKAPQEEPTESEAAKIDLAKPKQVDQEFPSVIQVSENCCLHIITESRTDNNLESTTNNSSSRKERRQNRKGRNGQKEVVTLVLKEPQTDESSAEPKDTAAEADTASANPQTDVHVDSTKTTPTEVKRNRRRQNKKKDTGDDTTNLLSHEWFF